MDLKELRLKELKEICRSFGIRTTGRKNDIIERLLQHPSYQKEIQQNNNPHLKNSSPGSLKRQAKTSLQSTISKKTKGIYENEKNLLFEQFEDKDYPSTISEDGIISLCEALHIDIQDPVMLVLCFHMEAKSMESITRIEFMRGINKLNIHSIDGLRNKLPELRQELIQKDKFPAIYAYTFTFAKDAMQKSLSQEIAIDLWKILLPPFFPLLKYWIEYIQTNSKYSISKDLWLQVLEFGQNVAPDLHNFDENGAWPVLIDEFVEYMRKLIEERGLQVILETS